jgi:hypothetical protein
VPRGVSVSEEPRATGFKKNPRNRGREGDEENGHGHGGDQPMSIKTALIGAVDGMTSFPACFFGGGEGEVNLEVGRGGGDGGNR